MKRRDLMKGLIGVGLGVGTVEAGQGQKRETELTTGKLVAMLLRYMDKAAKQGMKYEAEVLREAAEKVLKGGK